jgi:hypothetical protein
MKIDPKTAERIADVSNSWRGRAFLYKLSVPCDYQGQVPFNVPIDSLSNSLEDEMKTEYVVASAVFQSMFGAETYVFPAQEDGSAIDMIELPGSAKGTLEPDRAIEGLGYGVVSEPLGHLKLDNRKPIYEGSCRPGNLIRFYREALMFTGIWRLDQDIIADSPNRFNDLGPIVTPETLCFLTKQPTLEKDFGAVFVEVLVDDKIYSVLIDRQVVDRMSFPIFDVIK